MKKFICFLMLINFSLTLCAAKDFSTEISSINAAGFPQIQVNLKVFNKQAEELKSDNFVISEDLTPISNFSVAARKSRHQMILVIDRSSSIQPAMNEVKRAAAQFVESMTGEVSISILSFGSDLDFNHPFSNDAKSLIEAIMKIRPWGGTALYDAIFAACEELADKASRNDLKTVVCLTDGRDSKPNGQSPLSTHTPDEVTRLATEKTIRIITVGLGNDIDEAILQNFSRSTGGWYMKSTSPDQLSKLYEALSRRMKLEKYYQLSYNSPKPDPDGSKRKLTIVSKLKGYEDQGEGEYTAPKKTVEMSSEHASKGSTNKMSMQLVFSDLNIEGPDAVFLSGPITPPPDSPVIGPNADAFLGNSEAQNQAIIDQARENLAAEHKKNYDQKVDYLNKYLKTIDKLQKENDTRAASPDLKDFEKPRVEYRNRYLQFRRQEIDLYLQQAFAIYQTKFQETSDELDYLQRIHVQNEPEDEDFFTNNQASATNRINQIKENFQKRIDECQNNRNQMTSESSEQRGAYVTHTTQTETMELPDVEIPDEPPSDHPSMENIEDLIDEKNSGDEENPEEPETEIPEMKEIAPFD